MKKNILYLVCIFMFLLAQNAFAQAPKANLTKKQKAFVGSWIVKEFDVKFPQEGMGAEEKAIFETTFQTQRQMMIGREMLKVYADGTMNMTDEEGKITQATWTYNENTNIFKTREIESQKEESMNVTWEGSKPNIVFEIGVDSETSEKNLGMQMKFIFGKK